MKRISFLSLLLLASFRLQASPVTLQQAREKARTFFMHQLSAPANVYEVKWQPSVTSSQSSVLRTQSSLVSRPYYIFNESQGRGYVLVSGDDQLPSILAYGTREAWNDDVPPALQQILTRYESYICDLQAGRAVPYISAVSGNDHTPVVSPLLTCNWNQTYPYNKYAPKVPEPSWVSESYKGRFAIGCGSVALAQIIKFWGAPLHPLDRNSLYMKDAYYPGTDSLYLDTVRVSISSSTTYDFANIPNKIKPTARESGISDSLFALQSEAVGTLLRDIAYSYNTYWVEGSGSVNDVDILTGAIVGMGMSYDSRLICCDDGNVAAAPYWNYLQDDLDHGRPIYFAGVTKDFLSGHAFNIDGYDACHYVHVNWGWGGSANDWFDPNILNPYGSYYPQYTFNGYNMFLYNLHPRMAEEQLPVPDSTQAFCFTYGFTEEDTIDYTPTGTLDTLFLFHYTTCPLHLLGYDYDIATLIVDADENVVDTFGISYAPHVITDSALINSFDSIPMLYPVGERLLPGTYHLKTLMRAHLGTLQSPWYDASSFKVLLIVNQPTGIEEITEQLSESNHQPSAFSNQSIPALFDLQGRPLAMPRKGEPYIRQGKKEVQ